MYIPDPWDSQIKFKPGVNNPPKTTGSGVEKIRFKPGVEQIKFKPGVNPPSGGNLGQIRFKPGVPNTPVPAGSSFRKAGSVLTGVGSGGGLLGTLGLTSTLTPIIYGAMTKTRDALATDRGKAFSQSVTSGNYGEALRHLTGAYNRTPGLTPVLPDESGPNPFLKKTGDEVIEVTGADGNPVVLDMNNPADVEKLQQIQPKVPERVTTEPATAPAPERSNMADKSELERMTAWVNANKGLAEKVKPGQAGYEEIQIALGRAPYFESQIDPQAFASNAVKSFSDTLKMDTVMPEGTTLGVADDLDEAYAKVSDPGFTEAIQKAFASGVNFATGARASKSPIKGTKPSQPFFEARTPGL